MGDGETLGEKSVGDVPWDAKEYFDTVKIRDGNIYQ